MAQVKLRLGLPSEDSMAGLAEEAAADARLLHTHELNITHYASQVRIGQAAPHLNIVALSSTLPVILSFAPLPFGRLGLGFKV